MANSTQIPVTLIGLSWKKVLRLLVEYLNANTHEGETLDGWMEGNNDQKCLWWVLTALRGPDYNASWNENALRDKESTTAVIRQMIGLRRGVGNGATVNADSVVHTNWRNQLAVMGGSYHFKMHVINAFKALGLSWDEQNSTDPVV